jgi:hypothetical protein
MSNFFQQELQKLFGDGTIMEAPEFVGQVCLGTLGRDLRARAQFATSGYADHYDTLKITVLNRTDGPVDVLSLNLKDVLGVKPVPNNPNFPKGVAPHIWVCDDKPGWYAYRPTQADYEQLRQAAKRYLDVFREREPERTWGGRKVPRKGKGAR